MITVKEDTTIAGISELRTHMDEILEKSKEHKVLIEKRNKPVAVIMAMERYEKMEKALELLEDYVLGFLALERASKSKASDYMDIEEVLKQLKKK